MRNSYKILFLVCFATLSFTLSFSQDIIKDGVTKFYYPNNQVSSEGYMKNGKPDGYWKTFNVSGILKSEGLRRDFLLDSTWTFYNDAGEIDEKIDYKYGKKNGYSYKFSYEKNASPVIISKELYVNDRKEGKAFYYFPDGKLKEEISYFEGKKQGPGKEYDKDGVVITLLEYNNNYLISREKINRYDANGMKQSIWKTFYPDGKVEKEMKYSDDKYDGFYKEFNDNGNLILSIKYKEGKIIESQNDLSIKEDVDFRRQFDENGVLISTGGYKDNRPVGVHRYYNKNGKIIESKIFDDLGVRISSGIVDETGSKEGPWKDYFVSGEVKAVGAYLSNLQSGSWTYYYKNGIKEQEGSYLKGLYDGQWFWYHQNGNVWREENYFNGREDGPMVEYSDSGNVISKGEYINGEKEGEWFYQVNDHKEIGNYQSGLRDGIWKYFYEDGTIQFEGDFHSDLAEGKHKYYYPDGVLKEERIYSRGVKEKNWKKYDEKGNVELTVTYKNDVEYRINGEKVNLPKGSVQTIK
jgi:antitoxin component YwqK of YwqJK toxin-antitoxin module